MQVKIISLILILSLGLSASAYTLSHSKNQIVSVGSHQIGSEIAFEVLGSEDNPEAYPKGTVIRAVLIEHRDARRLSRSEVFKAELKSATLPNGSTEELNGIIKIVPRSEHRNLRWAGNSVFAATGLVLGLTVDLLTLGLPVGRGGMAAWNAAIEADEAQESKLKAGAKGFVKGALMPLPWIVLKGPELNMQAGCTLNIASVDPDDDYTVAHYYYQTRH